MSYGIKVKNTLGDVIIDGQNKNFALYESGSETISSTPKYLDVTFSTPTPQIPIIALRPDSTTAFLTLYGYNKSGINWTGFRVGSYAGCTFDWQAYLAHPTTRIEDYGLVVRDSSENIIFDSARKYFRIFSVTENINLADESSTQEIEHADIENPYYLWAPERFAYTADFIGGHWRVFFYRTGIKRVTSTKVLIGWQLLFSVQGEGAKRDTLTQSLIVLK